ncbi:glycoside hydrolase family 1 protein [Ruania halotolerans]|uniref:glycoside hydrolase family 1 protein n=1 Tax=Ruania halotolerans TaxID=2897773 RepID=UPI001E36D732|nr:family 1 glycosylhydrolase [Ruania halotolerans]UFU07053.1 family 1 glycosylhydrolase [Ruania halotolerans]
MTLRSTDRHTSRPSGRPVPFAPTAPLPALRDSSVTFPDGFSWGAATAAYQVEGAASQDGRAESIWDVFCRVPGAVDGGHDGAVACDQYHRYREDITLLRELGVDFYRFSTSWARAMPDGRTVNRAGMDYYSRLVDELLAAGISPWLTLYHWDLPQALEADGGWPIRDTAYRFADYAVAMHEVLGDRVPIWTTLNEPWCSAFLGYTAGVHAPGRQSPDAGLAAAHHLLLGHGLALGELRRRDPDASVGLTLNFTVADPYDPADPADVEAARLEDGFFNRIFLDPIFTGAYPADIIEDTRHLGLLEHVRDGDLELISAPIDVLGVNYYNGAAVSGHPGQDAPEGQNRPDGVRSGRAQVRRPVSSPNPVGGVHHRSRGLPTTDMGWEVQPEGLTRLLTRLQRDYSGPRGTAMFVTENGAAYPDVVGPDGSVDDQDRIGYLDAHLRAVAAAIEDGADVRGYFAWSLLDNFEWALGYSKRFGLVRVDYETQERTVKASGRWYARVARTNHLPPVPAGLGSRS